MFNRHVSNEDTEADSFNLSYSDFFNSLSNSDLVLFRLSEKIYLLLRGTLKQLLTASRQAKNDTVKVVYKYNFARTANRKRDVTRLFASPGRFQNSTAS